LIPRQAWACCKLENTENMMTQSKSSGSQNKQSATEADAKSTPSPKAKQGKDAASHTKAGSTEGAGGGKKQARHH
jgi:hypothetical protein